MAAITHSQRIRAKIDLVLPEFMDVSKSLVTHPRYAELYPETMVAIHWMIRASVPLMQTALERCRQIRDTDRVAAAMIPYLTQHVKEEMHHDEWILEDLELIGVPRDEVLSRIPSAAAASLVGARYYWILHHHPVAEMGAIAVMEGHPPNLEVIDLMVERTGLPRAAFRTIEKHAHLDQHHRDELFEALDRLPLEAEHHELIGLTAIHAVEASSRMYREVLERADEPVAAC